jgi:hypothetical protein
MQTGGDVFSRSEADHLPGSVGSGEFYPFAAGAVPGHRSLTYESIVDSIVVNFLRNVCATCEMLANRTWLEGREPPRISDFSASGHDLQILQVAALSNLVHLVEMLSVKHRDGRLPFAGAQHCPIGLAGGCELTADHVGFGPTCVIRRRNRASAAFQRRRALPPANCGRRLG